MKKTVLIFGLSSFVGSNLAQMLKEEFRVVGTYFKTPVDIPGVTSISVDVLKKDYVTNITALFKPDITIYAVGLSSLTECQNAPKEADALNSVGAINCCTASERYGAKFILLSSCFVMGGEDQLYREGDMPFPNTAYGNSLSSTEFYIQRSSLNYLILRSSPLYGRSFSPTHDHWFESMQAAFARNMPVLVDDSVVTGFLDVYIVGKILIKAIQSNVSNRLFQVSSKDWITRFEFARLYAKVFKKDENLIQRANVNFPLDDNSHNKAASNYFFKLDTFNLAEFLGAEMPSIEDSLQLTYKRLHARV